MITADFKNKKRAYGRFNCIFQIILCFLDLLSYSLRLLYTCLVHYCILVFHSHLWYGINLQDSNLLRWKKIMIFVPASLWQSAVAILPMGRGGDHGNPSFCEDQAAQCIQVKCHSQIWSQMNLKFTRITRTRPQIRMCRMRSMFRASQPEGLNDGNDDDNDDDDVL